MHYRFADPFVGVEYHLDAPVVVVCYNEIVCVLVNSGVGMHRGVSLYAVVRRVPAEILGSVEIHRYHTLALAAAYDLVDIHFVVGDDVFVLDVEAAQQPYAACQNAHRQNNAYIERRDYRDEHQKRRYHQRPHCDQYLF